MENDIDNLLSIKKLEEPTVPEEIITEILLRLPVKSLLKFKCVSKSWFVLISSYEFAKSHLKLSTKNDIYAHDRLVFVLGSKLLPMDIYTCSLQSVFECSASNGYVCPVTDANLPVHRVSIDYPYEANDWIWLEGSCNGLVCVSLSVSTLILWNPATRKLKALPDSGIDLSSDYYGLTYGFGFDELHDDYKVVEFFRFDRHMSEIEIQVKVYSLRTNSWKILSNWPGGDTFGGSAKFLNGAIHWLVTYIDERGCAIISHDLSTDAFAELPMPDIEDEDEDEDEDVDNDVRVQIKLLGGCLSICCEHSTYIDIWVMKEYGVKKSWSKDVRIPFYLNLEASEFLRPSLLFLTLDGKILINYGSNLRLYDPINPHNHHFCKDSEIEAITYFESLVSPNLND
ncbi:hypothetical protein BUALT_Bualt02G0128200 [Buddleja alternifolia]|uniref:F-box domain-containing protein n=1 Tax=Buddleja alternifolia TaxID=168488 RepID=A0AAV6XZT4_9LAMI|nr:hypothetical protein BUALT_Bualt02G0128200 [Buddleja alternifolia]